ncbi:hypothetical protein KR018_008868 [Drosophila ironensis]|nr:hypothetical protein KR018_008868 [Drosophila ironensis]
MLQYLLVYIFLLNRRSTNGNICVTKVIVRVPREKDIGLIFDLTITNRVQSGKREVVDFVIAPDGECTVNTTQGEIVKSVGRIFGGDFGTIEPSRSETISLVWPTVSLYNRVGSCPISITTKVQNAMVTARQLLHFDTRFETLDPKKQTLQKRKDFVDCHNWDMNYLCNCTPLNCEERYFGQRSFFNWQTHQCERVAACPLDREFYDPFGNEARDLGEFMSDDELDQIRQGKFDLNLLDLRGPPLIESNQKVPNTLPSKSATNPKDCEKTSKNMYLTLADLSDCFRHIQDNADAKKLHKKSPFEVPLMTQLYYDWFLPIRTDTWGEGRQLFATGDVAPRSPSARSGSEPLMTWLNTLGSEGWLLLGLRGVVIILLLILFQIIITMSAYMLVCLCVYGFIELYAKFISEEAANALVTDVASCSSSLEVITASSLMSHRQ